MQRRQSFLSLVQPHFESTLAIAERLALKLEPLRCRWLRHLLEISCNSTTWQVQQAFAARADWRGVYQGREWSAAYQQPMHVASSSLHGLHVVHVVRAIGVQQQAARASMSP